jgi:hypothetical protein
MNSLYDLAAEFFRWEIATTIACAILGVNAFDQPDVQLSKDITKKKINQFSQSKALDEGTPAWTDDQNKSILYDEIPRNKYSTDIERIPFFF